MSIKRFSFSKELRLLSPNEFINVFKHSYKLVTKEITIFFKTNDSKHARIGIIITKKNIKHAYKRNHIKRHIRNSFRLQQHNLPKMDYVIKVQKNININNHDLRHILENIWRYNYAANLKTTNKTDIYISNIHKSTN